MHRHDSFFRRLNKNRIPWLLVALALMLTSAYSIARLLGATALIGGWTGLPQHDAELPRIQVQAQRWKLLAIFFPFLAALVLGFGKASSVIPVGGPQASLTYAMESRAEKWTAPIVRYFARLGVSILGTFGFLLVLLFMGSVFYNLRIHAG